MILQIGTFHKEGGAAVAALRLQQALIGAGEDCQLLVHNSDTFQENVTPWADTKFKKKLAWMRFVGERLTFLPHEKDSTVRFAFSPASVGVDISHHPLVQKADILHLHWINFGFLSLNSLAKLFTLNKPIIWTMHDMWAITGGCHYSRGCNKYQNHCHDCPYLSKPSAYDISFEQFEIKTHFYKKPNLTFVSPSNWLTTLTQQAPLRLHHKAITIPNCIDTEIYRPIEKNIAKETLGLPISKRLILFSGVNTADPRKGYRYFEEAINSLTHSDVEVLIFGKGKPEDFKNIKVKVHFLGKITETDKLVAAYCAADLIAVPSLEDNLPNTIMEAMACGTPVVGFNTGGIAEMINHLKNGYVAESASASSLTHGINFILDQSENKSLGIAARQKVLTTYSENQIAQQYIALYNSVSQSQKMI